MSRPADPWNDFRSLTAARIALGRAGSSLPTRELLDFGLAHARARDAVRTSFDSTRLADDIRAAGSACLPLTSRVNSRDVYLRRPDLGRQLSDDSRRELFATIREKCDLCIIVSDGLSSRATEYAVEVVTSLSSRLKQEGWSIAPVVVIPFARVSIQDEIGQGLNAALSLILLGERPGLGAPDSLGAYFVYDPKPGNTDAERNCISNIRPDGLAPTAAVATLHYLLTAARHRRISGVSLKDERTLLERQPLRIDSQNIPG